MDQDRFDQLARALGAGATRREGLRAALGGLLGMGLGAGAAAMDTDAKGKDRGKARGRADAAKRRHECGPDQPCPSGFDCLKQGKKRRCSCASGVLCNGACCPTGQVCQDGACIVPAACIAPGEPCKGVGKPCCDGRTCSSGQGGEDDVACYVHKTGACQSTADCVYGTACLDGRCGFDVPAPAALGASCNPDVGQTCADPAATCTRYTGPGAPAGSYCSLPLAYTCTGDPDCTCYTCGYANGALDPVTPEGGRDGRTQPSEQEIPRLSCCGPVGQACTSDKNCCLGANCIGGTCQAVCDVCASGCPYTTIPAAFAGMPEGSVVRIAPGTYDGDQNFVNTAQAKSMTFVRCGTEGVVTWLKPNSANHIWIQQNYQPPRNALAFVNLDFGVAPETSRDNRDWFSMLGYTDWSFLNCRFTGNRLSNGNAMQVSSDGRLTVVGCTFQNLKTNSDEGGAIYLSSGLPAVIEGCTFRDNGTTTGNGGALNKAFTGPVRIANTVFEGNYAGGSDGGAIIWSLGEMTLENVAIRGNSAREKGGGISMSAAGAGPLRLLGSTTITGNELRTNNAYGGGSAIYCNQGFGASCASKIVGITPASVSGNTPAASECLVRMPDNLYTVDCTTWCLPAGEQVLSRDNDCALCCNGCVAGSGDPATCA